MKGIINKAAQKGISYLERSQKTNGSFESQTSADKKFSNFKTTSSIFPTCLIFSALSTIENYKIKEKAKKFLLSQKGPRWSFNYWERNSSDFKKFPYPDDLDDTFCALSGLLLNDKKIIDGKILAKAINILAFCEKKEGGPYHTWIVPSDSPKSWKDIDLAANSNIAYFLSLQDIQLPSLNKLVEQAIQKNRFHSPYYASECPVIYFISRFYQGKMKDELIERILSRKNERDHWENCLDTAIAVSSLINLGLKSKNYFEKSIRYILNSQNRDGSWDSLPLTIELIRNGTKYFSGSRDLTTALCIEALKKFSDLNFEKNSKNSQFEIKLKDRIFDKTEKLVKFSENEDKKNFQRTIKKMDSKDNTIEIALLPYHFKLALGKYGKKISRVAIEKLGSATILGWVAYTIYDHFMDKESTEKDPLPVANICLRRLVEIFTDMIPKQAEKNSTFNRIMDRVETANLWELHYCHLKVEKNIFKIPKKLPDFKKSYLQISEKSIAHALGPVFMLLFLGHNKKSRNLNDLINFFRYYISAKQLSDDAHDWEKDLKKGQLTPVVAKVIGKFRRRNGKSMIDLGVKMGELRKIFWYETVIEISESILSNIKKAKDILRSIAIIENPEILEKPLDSITQVALKTIEEQKNTVAFLKNI